MSVMTHLESFNILNNGRTRISQSLNDLHVGEMESIIRAMSSDTILSHDNFKVNTLFMKYVIMNAFDKGLDAVNEQDMQNAMQQAISTAEKNGTFSIVADDVSTIETSETPPEAPTRKRDASLYPRVLRLVEASPEASKDEIIKQVQSNADEGTLVNYFYKARKELGLKNNGKRGRRKSNAYPTVLKLVKENAGQDRKTLVQLAIDAGINASTANVYVGKALKELV